MPSTSAKQHRFMAAIAHSPSFAKKVGVSQSVGKDFNAADKGKTFNKGGMMKKRRFDEGGEIDYEVDENAEPERRSFGSGVSAKDREYNEPVSKPAAKAKPKVATQRAAPQSFESMASKARNAGNSSGNKPYKYTPKVVDYEDEGDRLRARKGDFDDKFKGVGRAERLYRRDAEAGIKPYKKGGMMKESKGMMGKEMAFMKNKGAPKSMIKHEKAEMMGMKKGGMPMKDGKPMFMKKMNMGGMSSYAKGGGIESHGKTKGTMVRMATGGSVSSASRRADGIAQRGKTRC